MELHLSSKGVKGGISSSKKGVYIILQFVMIISKMKNKNS